MDQDVRDFLRRMSREVSPSAKPQPRMLRLAKRRRARTVVIGMTILALIGWGSVMGVRALSRPPAVPASQPTPCSSWHVVDSPNEDPSTNANMLRAVAAASLDDAWAAGVSYVPGEGGRSVPRMLHWNGSQWEVVPIARRSAEDDLAALAVVSATDVWAVGSATDSAGNGPVGLIEHWDGSRWSIVPVANPGSTYWSFMSVAAAGPDDVWAVGDTATGRSGAALTEHWDGRAWSVVPSPTPLPDPLTGWPYGSLDSVTAISPHDVWAVGEATNVGRGGASNTLAEHWDGTTWRVVPTPDVPGNDGIPYNHLWSVAAIASNDVWSVGSHGDVRGYGGGGDHALALHWDGNSWSVVDVPPAAKWDRLSSVSVSAGQVAAVGSTSGTSGPVGALVESWDGGDWSVINLPGVGAASLFGLSSFPPGGRWAVGWISPAGGFAQTLTLRCD